MTSERTKALVRQQPIKDQLPFRCPWGAQIHDLPTRCGSCQNLIDPAWIRGLIKQPVQGVIEVEAVAVCHPCRSILDVGVRVYEDGRVLVGSGGRWRKAVETPRWRSVWSQVQRLLRGWHRT